MSQPGLRATTGVSASSGRSVQTPTVVVLPGAGDSAASWAPLRSELNAEMPVVVLRRRPTASVGGLADYLTAVTTELTPYPGPLIVVGHSFGGLLARAWAGAHPDHVYGLVLVDATPYQAAGRRSIALGMHASATALDLTRALRPTGVPSALLRAGLHPLYPEYPAAARALPPGARRDWRQALVAGADRYGAAELRQMPSIIRQAATAPTRPRVPTIALASSAYGPTWAAWQRRTAQDLNCPLWETGDRSHNIHLRHPRLLAHAVCQLAADPGARATPAAQPIVTRGRPTTGPVTRRGRSQS
ncbi:MAG: alpha/beta hydrolase [Actinomycetales bacterium]|nr:alpha/beta hydrolase [Actinomycetales bacterium]